MVALLPHLTDEELAGGSGTCPRSGPWKIAHVGLEPDGLTPQALEPEASARPLPAPPQCADWKPQVW